MPGASLLKLGVSGLIANQAALRTVGHNISNTDTPGYSRQEVGLVTQNPQFSGAGYQGTGVKIDTVRRVVDEFATNQVRLDTSAFNALDSYLSNINQIDALLADVSTGLAPGIQEFFSSLHAAADDPTSIPVRQLVISQGESLVHRFTTVQSRLEQQNDTLNQQLDVITTEISSIAKGIANLNRNIVIASGRGHDSNPNDLLDTRDTLLRKLSEYVSVSIVQQDSNSVDIFIGNGQALVIGVQAGELHAVPGETDPFRRDLAFVAGGNEQIVTSLITGGVLGGLLSFREEILDSSINSVGKLGLTIADAVNSQHVLGLDLEGMFGGLFFEDINEPRNTYSRVVADRDNLSGNETRLSVSITDTNQLTDTDYVLSFPGPGGLRYVLSRSDNGNVVQKGILSGVIPDTVQGEGFEITFETGNTRENDRFLIQPTRYGGRDISLEIERPDRLAVASAISANSSLGNEGGGKIVSTEALDVTTPSFAVPGELSPPLVIVFTSQTTYDVMDNSNPTRPVDLIPPMKGLRYTPGVQNQMLPGNPGQTAVSSDGLLAGRLPSTFVLTPEDGPATNGYPAEVLTITTTDPVTGIVSIQPNVNVTAGESADSVARNLTALTGVAATARTQVFLSEFVNADGGFLPLELTVNGIQVNSPTDLDEPELLSPNYLADLITANPEFQALGISAKSDGVTLSLETAGVDLNIAIRGDSGDQFTLRDATGRELVMTGAGGSTTAELSGDIDRSAGYDFSAGGPYQFSLTVNGGTTENITLTGNQVLGSDVIREIQLKIDASNIAAGDVIVSMGLTGRISLTTRDTGTSARIEIIDVSPAVSFALGFEIGSDQGAEVQHEATVGGIVNVVMEDGVSLGSNAIAVNGNLFQAVPEARSTFLGFQVTIDGIVESGDRFEIDFNGSGVSDNRNGIALTAIETNKLLDDSSVSLLESYGRLVEFVGARTSQSIINAEASQSLLHQSELTRDGISGVNLDEEAANLIRFELAYNASAQVISVARQLFDTLINTFR